MISRLSRHNVKVKLQLVFYDKAAAHGRNRLDLIILLPHFLPKFVLRLRRAIHMRLHELLGRRPRIRVRDLFKLTHQLRHVL